MSPIADAVAGTYIIDNLPDTVLQTEHSGSTWDTIYIVDSDTSTHNTLSSTTNGIMFDKNAYNWIILCNEYDTIIWGTDPSAFPYRYAQTGASDIVRPMAIQFGQRYSGYCHDIMVRGGKWLYRPDGVVPGTFQAVDTLGLQAYRYTTAFYMPRGYNITFKKVYAEIIGYQGYIIYDILRNVWVDSCTFVDNTHAFLRRDWFTDCVIKVRQAPLTNLLDTLTDFHLKVTNSNILAHCHAGIYATAWENTDVYPPPVAVPDAGNSGGVNCYSATDWQANDTDVFYIELDAINSSRNTFKWKKNQGSWTTEVPCCSSSAKCTLSDGLQVYFSPIRTSGTVGDKWTIGPDAYRLSPAGSYNRAVVILQNDSLNIDIRNLRYPNDSGYSIYHSETNGYAVVGVGWHPRSEITDCKFISGEDNNGGRGIFMQRINYTEVQPDTSKLIEIADNYFHIHEGTNTEYPVNYNPCILKTRRRCKGLWIHDNVMIYQAALFTGMRTGYTNRGCGITWQFEMDGADPVAPPYYCTIENNICSALVATSGYSHYDVFAASVAGCDINTEIDTTFKWRNNYLYSQGKFLFNFGSYDAPGWFVRVGPDSLELDDDSTPGTQYVWNLGAWGEGHQGLEDLDSKYFGAAGPEDVSHLYPSGDSSWFTIETTSDTCEITHRRTIKLYVKGSDGDPVVNAACSLWNAYGTLVAVGTTNYNGRVMDTVSYGYYGLYVSDSTSFNDFVFRAQYASDKAYDSTFTVGWTDAGGTDTVTLAGTPGTGEWEGEGPTNQAPVVSGIPNQTVSEGASFATITLDNYVADPDDDDDEMIWTYSGQTSLSPSIVSRVATIGIPTTDWYGAENIIFRATDSGGLYDQDTALFTVTPINDAPIVTNIPGETINEGATFETINLDDYVSDVDGTDGTTVWTYSGNSELTVDIAIRVATITIPSTDWYGSEEITFRATDTGGLYDTDPGTFTVTAVNDTPVVSGIADQTVPEGSYFTAITLDNNVTDVDNSDAQITWTYSGNDYMTVDVTDRVATVSYPFPGWNGSDTIIFRGTDPGALYDQDTAVFRVVSDEDTIPPAAVDDLGWIFETDGYYTLVSDSGYSLADWLWSAGYYADVDRYRR